MIYILILIKLCFVYTKENLNNKLLNFKIIFLNELIKLYVILFIKMKTLIMNHYNHEPKKIISVTFN